MSKYNKITDHKDAQLNRGLSFSPEQLLREARLALVASPRTRVPSDCPDPNLINVISLSPISTNTLDVRTLCRGNRLPATKEGHLFEYDKPCARCVMEPFHQTVFRQENGQPIVYLYTGNY
jgi:hypothetical protein